MYDFLMGLASVCLLGLIVGLFKPRWVIWWGHNKTRKDACLFYGIAVFIFVYLASPFEPAKKLSGIEKQGSENVQKNEGTDNKTQDENKELPKEKKEFPSFLPESYVPPAEEQKPTQEIEPTGQKQVDESSLQGPTYQNENKQASDEVNDGVESIDASVLYGIYEDNEVRADKDYGNKWLKISGTINSIKSFFGFPQIYLKTNSFGFVVCKLTIFQREKAIYLYKGQPIVVVGKCDGKSLGSVYVSKCSIIP